MASDSTHDPETGFETGEWTFIDRELQHPFEGIAEDDIERLRRAYRDRGWEYELIQPDGTREVFNG